MNPVRSCKTCTCKIDILIDRVLPCADILSVLCACMCVGVGLCGVHMCRVCVCVVHRLSMIQVAAVAGSFNYGNEAEIMHRQSEPFNPGVLQLFQPGTQMSIPCFPGTQA